jgi:hypothetical protein
MLRQNASENPSISSYQIAWLNQPNTSFQRTLTRAGFDPLNAIGAWLELYRIGAGLLKMKGNPWCSWCLGGEMAKN